MLDLPHHVLERPLELALGGDFLVERFHDGEEIAVECNGRARRGLDRAHGYTPKLLTALGSSGWISMKFCAPVMVSIVSTRFWTPASLRVPPAALACRYRSIRQPIVALSTYPTDDRSTTTLRSPAAMSCVTAVENSDSSGY